MLIEGLTENVSADEEQMWRWGVGGVGQEPGMMGAVGNEAAEMFPVGSGAWKAFGLLWENSCIRAAPQNRASTGPTGHPTHPQQPPPEHGGTEAGTPSWDPNGWLVSALELNLLCLILKLRTELMKKKSKNAVKEKSFRSECSRKACDRLTTSKVNSAFTHEQPGLTLATQWPQKITAVKKIEGRMDGLFLTDLLVSF